MALGRRRWPRLWGCGLMILTILAMGAQGGLTSGDQKDKSKQTAARAVNPCRMAEKYLQEVKKAGGDPKLCDCLPLKIKVVWEEEEKAANLLGRTEWYKLTRIEKYHAYLLLTYESRKKKQLVALDILGPAPEENGLISCGLEDFQGSMTGEYAGWINNPSQRYKEFPFDDIFAMSITPQYENPPRSYTCQFNATWNRMINRPEVQIDHCLEKLDLIRIMPESFNPVGGGIFTGMGDLRSQITASGPKALTYDEIMGGIKNGLVIKYFSEKQRGLTVDVTVFIEFGKK